VRTRVAGGEFVASARSSSIGGLLSHTRPSAHQQPRAGVVNIRGAGIVSGAGSRRRRIRGIGLVRRVPTSRRMRSRGARSRDALVAESMEDRPGEVGPQDLSTREEPAADQRAVLGPPGPQLGSFSGSSTSEPSTRSHESSCRSACSSLAFATSLRFFADETSPLIRLAEVRLVGAPTRSGTSCNPTETPRQMTCVGLVSWDTRPNEF